MTLSLHQSSAGAGGRTSPVPLGSGSLLWRLGMPRTALLVAGRALLLQTMHPVVGAGVRDFSDFRADPWGRLDRTLTSLQVQLFGDQAAAAEARRLRVLHKEIRGIGFDGARYSALDPDAYAWVHLSNFDTLLCFHRWFGRPLRGDEQRQAYAEWKQAGRVLGVDDRHMPEDVTACRAYVRSMVADTLSDNETARDVLGSLRLDGVAAPPWKLFPEALWRALRPAGRLLLHDATVGTLPGPAREKLGLSWSTADRRRLQGLALVVRAGAVAVPDRLLQYPLAYRAQRVALARRVVAS
ncbi:MAG TPA: oxygenase MpaB family protein [Acidimicrobiales bacterium]|nr:oxygenase MpaB family protein [Acidimicrobiales bacterium]